MTKQEMYIKVKEGLLAQNARCKDERRGSCKLRAIIDGTLMRCAVGMLFPDEVYKPEMEECVVHALASIFPELKPWLIPTDIALEFKQERFLQELQAIHDGYHPADWPAEFEKFALKWELQP